MGDDMSDYTDRPTRAEAEWDMRDDRTPVEKALDMNAYCGTREHDDGRVTTYVAMGYPASFSMSVPSMEVGRALVAILNLTEPLDITSIINALIHAYGRKILALETLTGDEDDDYEPETEWDDDESQYDPF